MMFRNSKQLFRSFRAKFSETHMKTRREDDELWGRGQS